MPRYRVVHRDKVCVLRDAIPRIRRDVAVVIANHLRAGRYSWEAYRQHMSNARYATAAVWFVIREENT